MRAVSFLLIWSKKRQQFGDDLLGQLLFRGADELHVALAPVEALDLVGEDDPRDEGIVRDGDLPSQG
jgi:hypothetical protein